MNQGLLQKLKRVHLKDFFHIFLLVIAFPLAFMYRKKHPNLWLFSDCVDEARDNAFWLFKYVAEVNPDQEIVFALNPMSVDFPKVKRIGSVVAFGSFRHWIYYLCAKNNISSQKAAGPNAAVCYILERFRLIKGNKVFLQHGIIKDDISYLHYKYTNIRLFTCSVQRELEYVQRVYGYPVENVRLLGLCRFDQLSNFKIKSKMILIMPTWRKWLSHPTEGIKKSELENIFLLSKYYKNWLALLNSQTFIQLIEQFDLEVVFYLHREAQKYTDYFYSVCPNIKITRFPEYDVQELLKEAQILITDYSSVAMDFAYMDKPLLYYQFDYFEFRQGHLEEGYFDYVKDGFGPVCVEEQQLIDSLLFLLSQGFNEMYIKRRNSFFTLKDNHNCERTLRAIQMLN